MDARVAPQTGLSASAIAIAIEQASAAPNYAPIPVVIERGEGAWLWDVEGKRYLDFMSAYSAVSHGHGHPRLVAALTAQARRVAVTSRAYHSTELGPFLARLVKIADLRTEARALPANGGCESVETAIKAARRWGYRVKGIAAGRAEIAVARGNFHGRSSTVIGFSTEPSYCADFGPFGPGFRHFEFGDIASLAAAINENTAAVLLEPIQGEAGIIVPPEGYLKAVRRLCDERNVLLILDEIQSGLGRTGAMFAYMHEDFRPDGVIVGKALGGGLLPVSAFVARADVMNTFDPGSHGSTFGGNPLAARVGLEAIDVLVQERLVERSRELGEHLLNRLRRIDSPLIVDVRGRGLWVGVELDRCAVSTRAVVERMAARGVLSKETHETVIRFAPPLVISREALDWGIDVFVDVLSEFDPSRRGRRPHRVANDGARTLARNDVVPVREGRGRSTPHLMMSSADHFEVSYRINPWMEPSQWAVSAGRLADDARRGWAALRATYARLGATVDVQAPVRGLPDLVFTANAAVVLDRKVMLARFLHGERQGEEVHNRAFFEALRVRGVVDEIVEPPVGLSFEGAGDAIWDVTRRLVWTGYGQRSSREMYRVIEQEFGVPAIALELVDPRFYHLDTCFCVLEGGEVLWYPAAFSASSAEAVREIVGEDQLIEATDDDAFHLGVNSVCIGRDVVMCHVSPVTRAALEARGYRVHRVHLESFNRSGGAAFCLTLRLDHLTGAERPLPDFCEDDFDEMRDELGDELRRAA